MWQRFTEQARRAVIASQEEANEDGSAEVQTYHVLLGITRATESRAVEILGKCGVSPRRLRDEMAKFVPLPGEAPPPDLAGPQQDKQFTDSAKRVLQQAYNEARQLNHSYVGTEHLLLGLLADEADLAARVLANLGVDVAEVRRRVGATGASEGPTEEPPIVPKQPRAEAGGEAAWPRMEDNPLHREAMRGAVGLVNVIDALRREIADLRRRVECLETKAGLSQRP